MHKLDFETAKAAGHLCGATGTADVIDASVVLVARGREGVVLTSDADHIRRIDPHLDLVECWSVGGTRRPPVWRITRPSRDAVR